MNSSGITWRIITDYVSENGEEIYQTFLSPSVIWAFLEEEYQPEHKSFKEQSKEKELREGGEQYKLTSEDDTKKCPICTATLGESPYSKGSNSGSIFTCPECKKKMCLACIQQWGDKKRFKSTISCPMCRKELSRHLVK